jgi:hypothetical protein
VKLSVVAGDALLLAIGPPRGALSVSGPGSARPGEHPRFAVTSSTPGKRLVQALVFGPDGTSVPEYARTLLLDGAETRFALPFALDDAPGSYRLHFADVLSGASAETRVELR